MATQELVWKEVSNPTMIWVKALDITKPLDVTKEKDDIMMLVANHNVKPSFDEKEIEYTLGEKLVIEDTNNVLSYFTANNENVTIEGNKLILNENFSEEEITLSKVKYTDNEVFVYVGGDSQKMVSAGIIDNLTSKIKVKLSGGTIELNKLDEDTKTNSPQGESTLNGAIYELYNEEGLVEGTFKIGEVNKLENIPLGKYILKEKIPSKGYLLDTNNYNIEITKDKLDVKLDVYEKVIKRKIEIFKVFGEEITGELFGEPDVTFEIYDNKKNKVTEITTDNEGYAEITLPYGTYTFRQITTTQNYHKVKDFKIIVSEFDERPIHKILSNSRVEAKVKIIKKDMDTRENILNSDIKFKIYDLQNNKYLSFKVSYPENKVTEELEVDKNGILITPTPLPAGTYHIYEVKQKMEGYLYNYTPVQFTINEDSNLVEEDGELLLEVPFYNKRVEAVINITKYGEEIRYIDNTYYYRNIPLEGVKINLYAKEDIYQNSRLIYHKDELVKELITDINGQIKVSNLPLGAYYIKEIETINNHILDTNSYDVELKYKDENTEIIEESITLQNKLPRGKLIIQKYETGTTIGVPNTLVEIHNKDNKIIYKGYTDKDGTIIIEDIPYGDYHLSELEAATGYRILKEKLSFEITEEEKIIKIYNERIKIPNTGFTLNMTDILVVVLTLIGFLLIITNPRQGKIVFICILIIILGITYYIIKIYSYSSDIKNNKKSISAYINNEIEEISKEKTNEKYKYASVLEIPTVNIQRGILDINNEYNSAKYNIELVKEDENTIVLASHNGHNQNSYFGNLHNIELGDEIKYYKDGILYTYIFSESYDIKKNGYADIYSKEEQKSIILITCKDNTNDAQTVYIGYLNKEETY